MAKRDVAVFVENYKEGEEMKIAVAIGVWLLGGIVAWVMWNPVLHFLLSLIPETAQYAWVGKIICIGLVGYFGGIGFPIACLIIGFIALLR